MKFSTWLSLILVYVMVAVISNPVSGFSAGEAEGWASISLGAKHQCGLTKTGEVHCWGSNSNAIKVPSTLGKVVQLDSGEYVTCALDESGNVTCWGNEGTWLDLTAEVYVPRALPKAKQISVNSFGVCIVTVADEGRCWEFRGSEENLSWLGKLRFIAVYEDSSWFGVPCVIKWDQKVACKTQWGWPELNFGEVKHISSSSYHRCAVTVNDELTCIGNNEWGQISIPADLGKVLTVVTSDNDTCVVTISGSPRCFGLNFREPFTNAFWTLTSLTTMSTFFSISSADVCVSSSAGDIRCLGSSTRQPPEIPLEPSEFKFTPSTGKVTFKPVNSAFWTIRNETDNKDVCTMITDNFCRVPGLKTGVSYVFSLEGQNTIGQKSRKIFTNPTQYCPSTLTIFDRSSYISGSIADIKGFTRGFCSPLPTTYKYRFREKGSNWQNWKIGTINKSGAFTWKGLVEYNSELEVRISPRVGPPLVKVISVDVEYRTANPLSFKWKPLRVNGFNQGAEIDIKFSGHKSFSGECLIVALTERGYNFAGTYMGREEKTGSFRVSNGLYTGKFKMKWNGKSKILVVCNSQKFSKHVSGGITPTFQGNW